MAASRPQLVRDSCYNPPSTNTSDDKQPADRKASADAAGGVGAVAPGSLKHPKPGGRHITIFGHSISMRLKCHRYCVVHMIRKAFHEKTAKDSKAGD